MRNSTFGSSRRTAPRAAIALALLALCRGAAADPGAPADAPRQLDFAVDNYVDPSTGDRWIRMRAEFACEYRASLERVVHAGAGPGRARG